MFEKLDEKKGAETVEEILRRRKKEIEEMVTQKEINQEEIDILMGALDMRFERMKPRDGEKLTAEGLINELKDLLLNKYHIPSKMALGETIVCLYNLLEL